MSTFMNKDFFLNTATAKRLYHDYAAHLPIIDYHSHLPQGDILARKKFRNMTALWICEGTFGDHYKWRLMRAAGIDEKLITGNAPDREKFNAFCRILPHAAGNPIYHFSHLELRRIFGMDIVINEKTADQIWEEGNANLLSLDTWGLLEQAKVEVACTTDDPADNLLQHAELAKSALTTKVLPAFRPDKALRIGHSDFISYLEALGNAAGITICSFSSLLEALSKRVDFFHAHGARLSDHALDKPLPDQPANIQALEAAFTKRLAGKELTALEQGQHALGVLSELGHVYAAKNWTMCLHIGAQRNNSSRLLTTLGVDMGGDSGTDLSFSSGIATLLDSLDKDGQLPKTMLFCIDSTMNNMLTTLAGCFQDGKTFGKVQFGPAWWFNDHKDGNLKQIRDLASNGLLGAFVGMVTDSRSFASYPRHDYFRRLLCRQIGEWVEDGEYPNDQETLSRLVQGICYGNAKNYFGLM